MVVRGKTLLLIEGKEPQRRRAVLPRAASPHVSYLLITKAFA
jgi:hypothetical protein